MKNSFAELVFIIDRSGSMSGLEEDTIGGFNSMLKQQQGVDGEAAVTTVLFDDQYELLHDRVNIHEVVPLTRKDYTARGSTALLDAIGRTIHNIRKVQREVDKEHRAEKVIFFILTDGQENASRHYTASMIQQRIEHQKKKYGWEFLFFGANMDAIAEAAKIGIGADRVQEYCADSIGTASVYTSISAMSTSFRTGDSILLKQSGSSVNDAPQSAQVAFRKLRTAMKGLKEAADEMCAKFSDLIVVD
ncbi:MAG: VWA domain-containing protein [Oscillospiraceae bacterium]|nr:VWA domain-containing protein [Oscillospiraceae bacterium]